MRTAGVEVGQDGWGGGLGLWGVGGAAGVD